MTDFYFWLGDNDREKPLRKFDDGVAKEREKYLKQGALWACNRILSNLHPWQSFYVLVKHIRTQIEKNILKPE